MTGIATTGTLALLAGVTGLYFLPGTLPSVYALVAGLSVLTGISLMMRRRPAVAVPTLVLGLGVALAWSDAAGRLDGRLAPQFEGRDLVVSGTVAGLPETAPGRLRFLFKPERLVVDGAPMAPPGGLFRLNWYRTDAPLRAGEYWQLTVRLKRPRGSANPGVFDYERWLFRHDIGAAGYVRESGSNRCIGAASGLYAALDRLRAGIADRVRAVLPGSREAAILTALTVGDRSTISDAQWELFRATGTGHLMAISGLHVGLVAGLVLLLADRAWRLVPGAPLRIPAPRAALPAALLAAAGYAALAGFSIPTRRALLMLLAVGLAPLVGRRAAPHRSLGLALVAILLVEPVAVLDAGFWLSFGAVAVIVYVLAGRASGGIGPLRLARVQWAIFVGLLPFSLLLTGELAPAGLLANLFAVPWMGMLVVPVALLGGVLIGAWPVAGEFLLGVAAWLTSLLWPPLEWLADGLPGVSLPASGAALALAVWGGAWVLAPVGWQLRVVGALWLLPLFLSRPPPPEPGAFSLTLLDVGQGLSAVVRTRDHALVFDAGPAYRGGFDAGEAIVVPYLRHLGVSRLDRLIVSHGDLDHIGGARAVWDGLSTGELLTAVPERIEWTEPVLCRRGQHWEWDGVQFRMLHPAGEDGFLGENDRSCVLLVSGAGGRALLTGDIEAWAERRLVGREAGELPVEVVVAPHHGSRTSSTTELVRATSPEWVLSPVGYRNRWGFPKPEVVSRWSAIGARPLDTASGGAITVRFAAEPFTPPTVRQHRRDAPHLWNAR